MWLTVAWNFIKPFAPYLLAGAICFIAYDYVYDKGKDAGKEQGYSNAITEVKKIVAKMPDCNCPKVQPCPALIDDKIKGKNISIVIHQHNSVEMNGDSLILKSFSDEMKRLMDERNLVRAKRL
jgi:hypothetical protein